jgi:trehalose/maltose transport system substrate-binding protein
LYSDPEISNALPQIRLLRDAAPESWVARPSAVTRNKYGEVSNAYYQTVHGILAGKAKVRPALAALDKKLVEITDVQGNRRN